MSGFDALVKFVAKENNEVYFAPTTYQKDSKTSTYLVGTTVSGYQSIENLKAGIGGKQLTVAKVRDVFTPLPRAKDG